MLTMSPSLLMFSSTLVAGTVISISASSWFMAWLGLELNLLSFIPLIAPKHNTFSSEAAFKYFLIQALGSATLLASVTTMLVFTSTPKILIFCSLMLKMAAAPLHFWLPTIMQGMSWSNCIILMTFQKIAPLVLTSYILCDQISLMLIAVSILSALMGGLGGLNQTLLRKLMAFSSINHMAWMLAAMSSSTNLWVHYIFTYTVISLSLIMPLSYNQIFHIKQLANFSSSQFNKMLVFLSLFSLGGLPPFLGFLPKMMVITSLINQQFFVWSVILTMTALISLFYYVRLAITSITLMSPKTSREMKFSEQGLTKISLINFLPMLFPLMTFIPI
uniref:NADH-ubiquinone oxidoreductase chain 2 n=1 Tax=Palaemon modestus TaxID=345840 RepID=A0A343SQN7_9EUCA|nr:NADH dehydrogenase subunit 2 [Palaemon modestus]